MPLAKFWKTQIDKFEKLDLALELDDKDLSAYFAAMFLVNEHSKEFFLKNSDFKDIFLKLWKDVQVGKNELIFAQKTILSILENEPNIAKEMLYYLKKIEKIGELDEDLLRVVKNLSLNIKLNEEIQKEKIVDFEFNKIKELLLEKLNYLEKQNLFKEFKNLEQIRENLLHSTFSIGVTGVMNSGKSTLLNTLLGRELLGTSTVPETANLSIIKHSDNPYAKVSFWSKSEWKQIENSASLNPKMEEFTLKTKENLKEEFQKYVTIEGVSKEINLANLSTYTSAKSSQKLCNIVKSVEIGTTFSLLDKTISIVDTPGLDDPVILREEITKHYLANCDILIHLMNANQAATLKDIDFIIDALTYQKISHLTLVITRIDSVEKDELDEVIEYVKKIVEKRLISLNKPHLTSSILSKIKIFTISSYYALLHRIGKSELALKDGWSIKRSGILDLEEHLKELVFGGERAKVQISSSIRDILQNIKIELDSLRVEKEYLLKSTDELNSEFNRQIKNKKRVAENIDRLNKNKTSFTTALKEYLPTMEKLSKTKFSSLQTILKDRLKDDLIYSLKKESIAPEEERVETLVQFTIKDGLIDLAREYRFEFYKYISKELDSFSRSSGDLICEIFYEFDPKAYQKEAAKDGILSANHQLFAQDLAKLISKTKQKKVDDTLLKLESKIHINFNLLEEKILPLILKSGERMIDEVNLLVTKKVEDENKELLNETKALENAIKYSNLSDEDLGKALAKIDEKILKLSLEEDSLQELLKVI